MCTTGSCIRVRTPSYPFDVLGDGQESEGDNIINVPLKPFSDSDTVRAAFAEKVLAGLRLFSPQFIFISAGFDAHAADIGAHSGKSCWTDDDYKWITSQIGLAAEELCEGRIVSVLEGGYSVMKKPGRSKGWIGGLTTACPLHVLELMRFSGSQT
jgi:acetoin utilization deacetylase AcuC-like enzyme